MQAYLFRPNKQNIEKRVIYVFHDRKLYTTLFSDVLFVGAKYETEKIVFIHSLHV